MIISAETLSGDSVLSAHLAVVGAGPAGIVVALEAAKDGLDVLLIESGYDKFNAEVQELSEPAAWNRDRHAPMSMTVRRQLGGTSTIWGGRCVPYDRVDFDGRSHITDTAWPFTYDELLPYYQRACEWLRCGRPVFDVTGMPHLPPSLVPGLASGDANTTSVERWSLSTDFGREYSDELSRSARVRVVTGLTCVDVICNDDEPQADQLACRTLGGKCVSVQARSYVLACGGLETTRLLLASRGPHGRPIGDHSGHLGSWYMGHVGGVIANVRFSTAPRATIYSFESDIDGTYVRRRFSISRDVQRQLELPNVIAYLANPELADYRHRNGILSLAYLSLRSPLGTLVAQPAHRHQVASDQGTGASSRPSAALRPHLANIARDWTSVSRFAAQRCMRRFLGHKRVTPGFFTAYSADNLYPLQYTGEQIPNRHSRVSLSGDRDSVGMPKLNIDLQFSKQDADGILRSHEVWDEYLRRNSCGRLEYVSDDPASAALEQMSGGSHQIGTTRMAVRAEDGVVDEHLAVHGFSNLFVVSSSAFLTSSQANPTFMIVVFALRLADRLKSTLAGL